MMSLDIEIQTWHIIKHPDKDAILECKILRMIMTYRFQYLLKGEGATVISALKIYSHVHLYIHWKL